MTTLLALTSLLLGLALGFLAACALIRRHDERPKGSWPDVRHY